MLKFLFRTKENIVYVGTVLRPVISSPEEYLVELEVLDVFKQFYDMLAKGSLFVSSYTAKKVMPGKLSVYLIYIMAGIDLRSFVHSAGDDLKAMLCYGIKRTGYFRDRIKLDDTEPNILSDEACLAIPITIRSGSKISANSNNFSLGLPVSRCSIGLPNRFRTCTRSI